MTSSLALSTPESADVAAVISDLTFSYPTSPELLRLSRLDIAAGKVTTILGPSGCGKTTLLLLLAGFLKASKGKVLLFGEPPSTVRASGSMSIVFQNATLLPWRSVLANVLLPYELLGVQPNIERALETLDLVGLKGFETSFVDELSGGMQTRVAIARALVIRPNILLMDEPFGNLDEFNRIRLNLALSEIQRSLGTTVFLITHNIHEAILMSDRVLILADDRNGGATTIAEDILIDFPNKTLEAVSHPRYQEIYQHILRHFHQKRL